MATIVDAETGELLKVNTATDERRTADKDFIKTYRRFISEIADLGMKDAQALRVLLFLAKHMDNRNAIAAPMDLIAEMLQITRQTVSQKVKYLAENGWICIYKLGRQNVYVINPDVFWTAYGDEKAYAKFTTTVMLSGDDNWEMRSSDRVNIRHIDYNVLRELSEREFPEPPKSGNDEVSGQMDITDFPEAMP